MGKIPTIEIDTILTMHGKPLMESKEEKLKSEITSLNNLIFFQEMEITKLRGDLDKLNFSNLLLRRLLKAAHLGETNAQE